MGRCSRKTRTDVSVKTVTLGLCPGSSDPYKQCPGTGLTEAQRPCAKWSDSVFSPWEIGCNLSSDCPRGFEIPLPLRVEEPSVWVRRLSSCRSQRKEMAGIEAASANTRGYKCVGHVGRREFLRAGHGGMGKRTADRAPLINT